MTEENKALVRRFFEESGVRKTAAEELLAPEFAVYPPSSPPVGLDTFRGHLEATLAAFSEAHHTFEDILAEGDRVALRAVFHGTHTGEYMGIPPSGSRVSVSNTVIARIADGKIAEWWPSFDMMGLMQQIGAGAAVGQAATSASG
jgi:predicted ester cyclase